MTRALRWYSNMDNSIVLYRETRRVRSTAWRFYAIFSKALLPQKFSIKLSVICTQSIIYLVHFARFVKTFVWILMPSLIRTATLCNYFLHWNFYRKILFDAVFFHVWKIMQINFISSQNIIFLHRCERNKIYRSSLYCVKRYISTLGTRNLWVQFDCTY